MDPMLAEFSGPDVALVHAAMGNGFRPVPGGTSIADVALMTSMDWCRRVFRVPVHRVHDGLRHAYRVADVTVGIDLLEHRLEVDGVPVAVYESVAFFVVVVPAAALKPADPLEKAAAAARLVFAVDGPVAFRPIPSDPARPAASTDPDCSLVATPGRPVKPLSDWRERIDAVFAGDDISLLVYKMTLDDAMTFTRDPATWFKQLRALPGP